jgi:hypothetical protein
VERSFGDALYLLLVAMALEKSVNLVVLVEDRASELADFVDNLRPDWLRRASGGPRGLRESASNVVLTTP